MSIYKGTKLVAGVPKGPNGPNRPDWDRSVIVSAKTLYVDGYVVPSNGIIVGWFFNNKSAVVLSFEVNGISVARASTINSAANSEGNVQCPVNEGDELSINTPEGFTSAENIVSNIHFVPYKSQ